MSSLLYGAFREPLTDRPRWDRPGEARLAANQEQPSLSWPWQRRGGALNGGRPGRQARSRAQGSIGVPPVFPIRVQDDDQKLAGRTLPRSHSPMCSRHSETQAKRLCYHRLGVMPPLRPARESSLLEMSKLQWHFVPGYDRTVPPGHFATGSSEKLDQFNLIT